MSFRNFTKSRAEKRSIQGWVRNLDDGRVEAIVQGEEANVAELLKELERGPLLAKVKEITRQKIDLQERFGQFSILEDSEKIWQK